MANQTVLLLDNSLLFHKVLQGTLKNGDYDLVEQADDGDQAIKLFTELRPAVVLLHIIMPKQDGLATLKETLDRDSEQF